MTSEALSTPSSAAPLSSYSDIRNLLLDVALLCVVGGSQYGMLMLAETYLTQDRAIRQVSPEAIAGFFAIALSLMATKLFARARLERDITWLWLIAFLVVASLGELLKPEVRLSNVATFISIGAIYLIGSAIGHEVRQRDRRIPFVGILLAVYTLWYLWLLTFAIRGELGFFGWLPASQLRRLQFSDGFRATELAIFIGLQLPILMYVMLGRFSPLLRSWATTLLIVALSVLTATLSAAALAASALVVAIFVVARRGISARSILRAMSIFGVLFVLAMFASQGLVDSVKSKLQDFAFGEGERALIYGELTLDIVENPFFGIGKGRFVETNNFSWSGVGLYPHQNILGIGAELGVPALLLYMGFVGAAVVRLCRGGRVSEGDLSPGVRLIAATALAVFAYQQFRGLFQDTWMIKEQYLWLGIGLGALARTAPSLKRISSGQ
jgi:O-antigen ligase